MLVALLLVGACKKEAPVEPAPTPPVAPPPPVMEERGEEALLRALSLRDGAPDCATLEGMVDEPVPTFSKIVAEVTAPPVAPMRAARCLIRGHSVEVAGTIEGWMTSPDTEGLARLVIEDLSYVGVDEARRFATAGLAGPHAAVLRPMIAESSVPEVKALAE